MSFVDLMKHLLSSMTQSCASPKSLHRITLIRIMKLHNCVIVHLICHVMHPQLVCSGYGGSWKEVGATCDGKYSLTTTHTNIQRCTSA